MMKPTMAYLTGSNYPIQPSQVKLVVCEEFPADADFDPTGGM